MFFIFYCLMFVVSIIRYQCWGWATYFSWLYVYLWREIIHCSSRHCLCTYYVLSNGKKSPYKRYAKFFTNSLGIVDSLALISYHLYFISGRHMVWLGRMGTVRREMWQWSAASESNLWRTSWRRSTVSWQRHQQWGLLCAMRWYINLDPCKSSDSKKHSRVVNN